MSVLSYSGPNYCQGVEEQVAGVSRVEQRWNRRVCYGRWKSYGHWRLPPGGSLSVLEITIAPATRLLLIYNCL